MTRTSKDIKITKAIAKKVLSTVDAGLVRGLGYPVPGQMCVEAAVCYAMGLEHSDAPPCVSRAIRALKISLNDSNWSSRQARATGLRRLALVQLGSAGVVDDREFAKRVAALSIRLSVPLALRAAASIQPDKHHRAALLAAARWSAADAAADDAAAAAAARWSAAAAAAAAAARDKALGDFAEGVVQILIEMDAPGAQWLYLTEEG